MLLKLIREYIKKQYDEDKIKPGIAFENAVDFAKEVLNSEDTKEEKIIVLDYIINTIKKDIQIDLLSTIIYSGAVSQKRINRPYPLEYIDKQGNLIYIRAKDKEIKKIDLQKDYVLTLPWSRERITDKIKVIFKTNFKYYHDNHIACYYPILDICYVCNGYHSIASGIYHKKGFIEAKIYDIYPLFNNIYTDDGVYWYNSHTSEKIYKIEDFRIGAIFEITKMKIKTRK